MQLEKDTTEVNIGENNQTVTALIHDWEAFKTGINSENYSNAAMLEIKNADVTISLIKTTRGKDTKAIGLTIGEKDFSSLIIFSGSQWEKFKKQINDYNPHEELAYSHIENL